MVYATNYRGCLIPNCGKYYQTRGVCGACYRQISKRKLSIKDKEKRRSFELNLMRAGVLLPIRPQGGKHGTIAVSIKAINLPWLPKVKANGECFPQIVFEDEPVEIDFMGIPDSVIDQFELSQEELNRIAWSACQWSPGTFEKQIVYQLRYSFGVKWSNPIGHGLTRFDDCKEYGHGTYVTDSVCEVVG